MRFAFSKTFRMTDPIMRNCNLSRSSSHCCAIVMAGVGAKFHPLLNSLRAAVLLNTSSSAAVPSRKYEIFSVWCLACSASTGMAEMVRMARVDRNCSSRKRPRCIRVCVAIACAIAKLVPVPFCCVSFSALLPLVQELKLLLTCAPRLSEKVAALQGDA